MDSETKRPLDLLGEIQAGLSDLDRGDAVSHERVAAWLKSWGKPSERKPPR